MGMEGRGPSPVELCSDELLSYDSCRALSEVLPASVPAGVNQEQVGKMGRGRRESGRGESEEE